MIRFIRRLMSAIRKIESLDEPVVILYHSVTGLEPIRMTSGSLCFDIRACLETESVTVKPHEKTIISTGLRLDIPDGYGIKLYARSGYSTNKGVILANGTGIIDWDYTGELRVPLINLSEEDFIIHNNDRIGQLEVSKYVESTWVKSPLDLIESKITDRTGGFGSTGSK